MASPTTPASPSSPSRRHVSMREQLNVVVQEVENRQEPRILLIPFLLELKLLSLHAGVGKYITGSTLAALIVLGGVTFFLCQSFLYVSDGKNFSKRSDENDPQTVFAVKMPSTARKIWNEFFGLTSMSVMVSMLVMRQIANYDDRDVLGETWVDANVLAISFLVLATLLRNNVKQQYAKVAYGGHVVMGASDVTQSMTWARFPLGGIDGASQRFKRLARMYQDFGHIVECNTNYVGMHLYCHPDEYNLNKEQKDNIRRYGVLDTSQENRVRDRFRASNSTTATSTDCSRRPSTAGHPDEDKLGWHDFDHMVKRQDTRGYGVKYFLPIKDLKVTKLFVSWLFRNFWNALLRFDHHVFIDMCILLPEYPALFEMLADKLAQARFFAKRLADPEKNPDKLDMKMAEIYNHGDELEQSLNKLQEDPSWNPVIFLKPRKGAFGEDCHTVGLGDFIRYASPVRNDFMLCERYLQTHPDLLLQLRALRLINERDAAVSVRVWTKRFRPTERGRVACLLCGNGRECYSNGKFNKTYKISPLSASINPGQEAPAYGCILPHGVVEIPFFNDVLIYADWVADQVPEVPFMGIDFMICPEGAVFTEANPMCSYSRYIHSLGNFYSLAELNDYLNGLDFMPEALKVSERKAVKFFHDSDDEEWMKS